MLLTELYLKDNIIIWCQILTIQKLKTGPDSKYTMDYHFAAEEDKVNIDKVKKMLQNCCIGETNVIYERYIFNNRTQEAGESYDSFVSNSRQLEKSCNYGAMANELIRDRIVICIKDSRLRRSMLQEPKLTLQSTI